MNLLRWIATIMLLSVVSTASSSGERNLEVATEMTCEQLMYGATTLYGSITDIEYAVSFALEEKDSISERRKISGDGPESLAELHEINLKISRLIAMHRLFQKPVCPLEGVWHSYKPSKIGRNSLWD